MIPIIVGSNLTDLGRNSLAAAQQEQDASQATSNRLLQYLAEQNRNRQANGDLSFRNRALDADTAYRNNALAQQMQMWNTPNATTTAANANQLAIAKMPYEQMTPAQQAQIDFENKQLEIAKLPYTLMQQGIPIGNGPTAQAAGQLMIDQAQRREKNDAALKAANATYLSTVDMWHPMDAILPGDRNTKIANAVRQQLGGAMPEVNELVFDRSANGGKGGFISPDQAPSAPAPAPLLSVPPVPANAGNTNQFLSSSNAPSLPQMPVTITNPRTGQRMQLVNGQWQAQ